MTNNLMKGKKGLIMGLANNKSIAWGIAKALHAQGAEIILSYYGEILLKRVTPLAKELNCQTVLECNVANPHSIERLFQTISKKHGKIDFAVHAIGFSDKDELRGDFKDTSKDNFLNTMDVSVFSFVSMTKHASNIMNENGSILTLTYHGSNKVVPHYNVMGIAKAALESSVRYLAYDLGEKQIRVNAISAGPIKTLAASGIGDFRTMLKWGEVNAPMEKLVSQDDVGGSALYLLSDLSKSVTGEIHYVDCGYSITAMPNLARAQDNSDILANYAKSKEKK